MLEALGLPGSFTARAERIIDEEVYTFEQASVVGLPPPVVLPAGLVDNEGSSPHAWCTAFGLDHKLVRGGANSHALRC